MKTTTSKAMSLKVNIKNLAKEKKFLLKLCYKILYLNVFYKGFHFQNIEITLSLKAGFLFHVW